MSAVLTNYVKEISESENPRKSILKWTRGIEKECVMPGHIIVATYARPYKTAGGIILSDNLRQEDVYQGSCGLIVAMAENAFKYDGSFKFEGTPPISRVSMLPKGIISIIFLLSRYGCG